MPVKKRSVAALAPDAVVKPAATTRKRRLTDERPAQAPDAVVKPAAIPSSSAAGTKGEDDDESASGEGEAGGDDDDGRTSFTLDPDGRKVKRCKMCGVGCFDPSPVVPEATVQQGWGTQTPWANGSVTFPVGRFDKICVFAYAVSLQSSKGSLAKYMAEAARDPAAHANVWPQIRKKYIEKVNSNPTGRVTAKELGAFVVTVSNHQSDSLIAPAEEFVTEAQWMDEVEAKTGQRPKRVDHPQLNWEQRPRENKKTNKINIT